MKSKNLAIKSTRALKSDFFQKKKKIWKYFLWKKGNGLFFNLKQVSLNSDENCPSYKSL